MDYRLRTKDLHPWYNTHISKCFVITAWMIIDKKIMRWPASYCLFSSEVDVTLCGCTEAHNNRESKNSLI